MPYCSVCDRDFKSNYLCPQCGSVMIPRATAGFAISLIAGVWLLIRAIYIMIFWGATSLSPFPLLALFIAVFNPSLIPALIGWVNANGMLLVVIGILSSIIIIVGSVLIYIPNKVLAGSTLTLIFTLISLIISGCVFITAPVSIVLNLIFFGSLIIGVTLGIVGALLGYAKK
ncbi:MAG: hypothetical protein QXL69_04565 [Candidatus Bathyarchaeia archaeon]|nr:hypothetical protein [Candidatus Bathyarchaeota archaeon]